MATPARSPADSRSDSLQGRLLDHPLAELLAFAVNNGLSGTLILEPPGHRATRIGFKAGRVFRAQSPEDDSTAMLDALELLLPPESLEFAQTHAREHGVHLFTAVERLALLPAESLELSRRAFLKRQVETAGRLPEGTSFCFVGEQADLSQFPGPAEPLEPVSLVVSSLLSHRHGLSRAREHIDPFKHDKLSLSPKAPIEKSAFTGAMRAIVTRLERTPESLWELRQSRQLPDDELMALIAALWLTGNLISPRSRISSPARDSHVAPPATSAVPPRKSFVRPTAGKPQTSAGRGAREQQAKELEAEAKVFEAWLKCEADPSRAERTSTLIDRVVNLFPRNPRIRYYNGCVHKLANRPERAAEEFQRVLVLEPGHHDARRELGLLNTLRP